MSSRAIFTAIFTILFCARMFAQENVPLIPATDPGAAWRFNNGQEFPGATGALTVDAEAKREGRASLKLAGDFTKGGNYVEAGRAIDGVDIRELSMWVRSADLEQFTLRINDASGQTHQIGIKTERGPEWKRIVLPLEKFFANRGSADAVANIAKYESWGGAKDGAWHGPATAIYILIGKSAEKKQVDLWLNDVSILPRAMAAGTAPFKSAEPIALSRTLENVERPATATTPAFKTAPGEWEISLATKAALHSPDNSYNAVVQLECLDADGKTIERITVADVFGEQERKAVSKRVNVPKGAATAQFQAQLNKTYEEAKMTDASIPVIATSVEPNEEYFKAGYGKWCDAYDFHIYESAADVCAAIGKYRALMKKYDVEKPIWSTELGLNSQGQTRHAVAVELIKKTATFFAAGGANMSWFCLLYPDADGKSHGSSGDSHNVFDCRYNRYAPRLDAIAYYNTVNAIAVKKFVAEKQYDGGIGAFLFRDSENRSLQVLWKDKGRADVAVPLAGVKDVQIIRIDGSRRALDAAGKSLTLTIGEDPLLLLYDGGEKTLPQTPGAPSATLESSLRGREITLLAKAAGADAAMIAPPFWTVKKSPVADSAGVRFTAAPPPGSTVREADFTIRLGGGRGELYHRATMAE